MCVEIIVRNLSHEAASRLGLPVGVTSARVDVPGGNFFRLSKDVGQLSEINEIFTEAALAFTLDQTERNKAIFIEYLTPNTLDRGRDKYECSVISNGVELPFDCLFIKGAKPGTGKIDCSLVRSAGHWVDLANNFEINRIDFGTATYFRENILTTWDRPKYLGNGLDPVLHPPFYLTPLHFGAWCDQTEPPQGDERATKQIGVADIRPLVSWVYLLKAGFCAIGWTLEGLVLESELFRRAWVYVLKDRYFDIKKLDYGGALYGRLSLLAIWDNTINRNLRFNLIDQKLLSGNELLSSPPISPGVQSNFVGIQNTSNIALKYKFWFNGEFHNDFGNGFTVDFGVHEMELNGDWGFTGEVLSDEPMNIEFAPNERKFVTFEQTVTIKPRLGGAINATIIPGNNTFKVMPGFSFRITPDNDSLMQGDMFKVSECIATDKLLDHFKGFLQTIDGRFETDFETKTVTVYPARNSKSHNESINGFLHDDDPTIELAVVPGTIEAKEAKNNLKRFFVLGFKESTDAFIQSLNLDTEPHGRKINNGEIYPIGTTTNRNNIYEATFEYRDARGIITGGRSPFPYLPALWDNTAGQRSFSLGRRLFFAFDKTQQLAPDGFADRQTSFYFESATKTGTDGLVTDFGYVTQLRTWELTEPQTIDGNFVFGVAQNDLFSSFFLGITQEMKGGVFLDVLVRMKMSDYAKVNFRDFYMVQYLGQPLKAKMLAIRDFSPCGNLSTPVTMFAEPMETSCCDLPCGCRFTECEYYSDFGLVMRQATLNDLKITSFMVDGVELIVSPIGFGTFNVVDSGGKPYVTNLVDALNSIGAPYFSFAYSTRLHPQKGKRFFKIKRPSCQPFKIVISGSGGEEYLYTHLEQKTKWFSSDWEALGYGDEVFTTPQNCVTRTEY